MNSTANKVQWHRAVKDGTRQLPTYRSKCGRFKIVKDRGEYLVTGCGVASAQTAEVAS
jgi:hypothetical protein